MGRRHTTERRDIQASNRASEGTFPSFLDVISPSAHDALLIPPHGLARKIKVRRPNGIQVVVRVIRVRQRDVRHVGHDGAERRTRAQRVCRRAGGAATMLPLHLRDGLVRRCRAGGGTLERVGARLCDEPRGVRVAVLGEVVDQRTALDLARVALFLLGAAELFGAQVPLAALGLLVLFQRLRVRLFALLVELDERCVFFSVGDDARLRFGDVDVVDEIEGWVCRVFEKWCCEDRWRSLISSTSCR